MSDVASRYISKGGRTSDYGRSEWTDDLMTLGLFVLWAENDSAFYGGHSANDAYRAMCRLLNLDAVGLRRALDV